MVGRPREGVETAGAARAQDEADETNGIPLTFSGVPLTFNGLRMARVDGDAAGVGSLVNGGNLRVLAGVVETLGRGEIVIF
jgi:hypothetical protein